MKLSLKGTCTEPLLQALVMVLDLVQLHLNSLAARPSRIACDCQFGICLMFSEQKLLVQRGKGSLTDKGLMRVTVLWPFVQEGNMVEA